MITPTTSMMGYAYSYWVLAGTRTYQSHEDASELYDVGVCDGVEAPDPGVADSNQGREHHGHVQIHVDDHSQGSACMEQEKGKLNAIIRVANTL